MIRKGSVSRTFTIGLTIMVMGLLTLTGLTLISFYDFSKSLTRFNVETVPEIIQSSQLAAAVHQLLADTERLVSADSGPVRRVAYNRVQEEFNQIKNIMGVNTYDERVKEELLLLERTLSELNGLIESDIILVDNEEQRSVMLFDFIEEIVGIEKDNKHKLDVAGSKLFFDWISKAVEIVNDGGKLQFTRILYKVNIAKVQLEKKFVELSELTKAVRKQTDIKLYSYENRLKEHIMGSAGLVELSKKRIKISLLTASRGNFARSLAEEFKGLNTTKQNIVISSAAKDAETMKKHVSRMVIVYSVIAGVAVLVAIIVIVVLHRKLTGRLLKLNEAIIARLNGQDNKIDISGDDEISEMAHSFEYFASVVKIREDELRELAMKDPLTGASNRRHFLDMARIEMQKAERFNRQISLLMLDLDHFKSINDAYGHDVGDEVLKNFTKLCFETLRNIDVFGRLGGEEFSAVLPETDACGALNAAERIRQKLEESELEYNGHKIKTTVSIGVSVVNGDGYELSAMMKKADKALYVAKESGRNCINLAKNE